MIRNTTASLIGEYARCGLGVLGLLSFGWVHVVAAAEPALTPPVPVLTNVLQVRQMAAREQCTSYPVQLDGIVLWSSPAQDQFFLQDSSGGMRMLLDLHNQPAKLAGQRVRLEGMCVAGGGIIRAALVDNDGLHGPTEKSGVMYLKAGWHPIRVEWFNGPAGFQLGVEYESSGLSLQGIPSEVLFRPVADPATGATHFVPGVEYRCYEGSWEHLPNFQQLAPVKSGFTTNFDLGVRSRNEDVALVFSSFLKITQSGFYTFWVKSDDGCRVFIDDSPPRLTILGPAQFPTPRQIASGQAPEEGQDCAWTTVAGTMTGTHSHRPGELEVELRSGTNVTWLHVGDAAGQCPELFSQIRATGIRYRSTEANERDTANRLIVPSLAQIEILQGAPAELKLKSGTVAQLIRLASTGERIVYPLRLKGLVLATDSRRGVLAFQDDSGAALIKTDLPNLTVQPGQNILLSGNFVVEGGRIGLRNEALTDNDGLHGFTDKSGAIFLTAGKHPIQLFWFTESSSGRLEVYFQGPDLWRERIPDTALFHPEVTLQNESVRWLQGLNYECYEGRWLFLPDCGLLTPARHGIAFNFDTSVASRRTDIALEFRGYLDAPRDGIYTFTTASDDGSRLSINDQPPSVEVTGTNAVPVPQPLTPRQLLREEQENRWSEVEGTVTFASEQSGALELELSHNADHMRVAVLDGIGSSPLLLLNSRIRAVGVAQSTYMIDGNKVAGTLLVPSLKQIQLLEVVPTHWTDHPVQEIGQLAGMSVPPTTEAIVHVHGQARPGAPSGFLQIEDGTGRVLVETTQPLPPAGEKVEAVGCWSKVQSNVVLRCGFYRALANKATDEAALPTLTTLEQVKALPSTDTQRGYPVKIRGVITALWPSGAFFLQDSTWAVFVNSRISLNTTPPQIGDYWEVEGVTYGGLNPGIQPRRAVRLGAGTLPEARRVTWDQLVHGNADSQYVEVRGVATSVTSDGLVLFTPSGKIRIQFPNLAPRAWQLYENALIRIRGCLLPRETQESPTHPAVHIRLLSPSFNVDETAPVDPFAVRLQQVSDLSALAPPPGVIQRVKVAGQVLCEYGGQYFLSDGSYGLRFTLKGKADLNLGDLVEVVGYLRRGGPSPFLDEALLRRTGHAGWPTARRLAENSLLNGRYDATLVRVDARLTGVSLGRSDQTLELQAGTRRFMARLDANYGFLRALIPGSRLEVTGVYAGSGGDPERGRDIDYFELLVNSPSDIRVLERPSWWTLGHTLAVVGAMAAAILGALVWITLLRRQVEQRSLELTSEIRRHELTRQQNALERERARIAKDMHDELGASVTQVGLLGQRLKSDRADAERTLSHAERICQTALELGQTLDEIVWAVNPRNDTIDKLAAYLALYAEEFFQMTAIRCRIDLPPDLPAVPISAEVRHNLFLGVKEALNNIVKHAGASEVWVRFSQAADGFQIRIEDNGKGFDPDRMAAFEDGLQNMRRRLETIGGRFELASEPGRGTRLTFAIMLDPSQALPSGPAAG